jgi:hypothetical protein
MRKRHLLTSTLRFACTKCARRGRYHKATLIERYGSTQNMVDLQLEVAAARPKSRGGRGHGHLRVFYGNRIGDSMGCLCRQNGAARGTVAAIMIFITHRKLCIPTLTF